MSIGLTRILNNICFILKLFKGDIIIIMKEIFLNATFIEIIEKILPAIVAGIFTFLITAS